MLKRYDKDIFVMCLFFFAIFVNTNYKSPYSPSDEFKSNCYFRHLSSSAIFFSLHVSWAMYIVIRMLLQLHK